jgi:enoyl-CoA hydratase/carnithine racemase
MALAKCKKPIVAVIRGGCYGMGFTLIQHATLVYCSADAKFKTPFITTR